jgi:hypothetical protein
VNASDLNPPPGHLFIKDLDFIIDSATLQETVDSTGLIRWNLWMDTIPQEIYYDEIPFRWAPNIRGDDVLIKAPPLAEIEGYEMEVPEAYDAETDEWLFTMYVFSHNDVFQNKIHFIQRLSNGLIRVKWHGLCNLGFSSDLGYGDNVPFAFQADFLIQ